MATRRAASIILYRHQQGRMEVFLTQRSQAVQSFPGFWVFPGGKQDPADELVAKTLPTRTFDAGFIEQEAFQAAMAPEFHQMMGKQPLLERHEPFSVEDWTALAVTAIRELWEETGMALTAPRLNGIDARRLQHRLLAQADQLPTLMEQEGFIPDISQLEVAGRITTPDLGPRTRRFDTAFFLVPWDIEVGPMALSQEVAVGEWFTPDEALTRYAPAQLAIPTQYILRMIHQRWKSSITGG
ncbi:MAG: hypothetical protein C7B44_13565 [Sulfobacillus thermosulfidooxidans]|nr:MAG: hypothetical protein C7B44_13565 [Sulfobacillus thermosulfidooxidans]